ncbi:hypothetical protein BGZ49_001162 [Haplosporangium sp. Z 27]|nr:hypothetical protein BGZ49_001162 [Haplosporangium sp. Z 27]
MLRNIFTLKKNKLTLEDTLEIANKHLESARKANDPTKSLKHSRSVKSVLKDAEKIFVANKIENPALQDGVASAYHEHGQLLDELGYHSKAHKSHNKAKEWGYIYVASQKAGSFQPDSFQPDNETSSSHESYGSPVALSSLPSIETAATHQGKSYASPVKLTETKSLVPATKDSVYIVEPIHQYPVAAQIPLEIFYKDVVPPVAKYNLPEDDERITSTPQLAYCLSLLNPSLISNEELDPAEFAWSQAKLNNPDEKGRLQAMGTDLVRVFVRDELKKPDIVAEIISLVAVLDPDDFRKVLQAFVDGIEHSVLLEIHLLDGLAQLVRNAVQGCFDADDLVKILNLLNKRLKDTHTQSTGHTYQLTLAISRVLDSMVDSQVKGLSREQLHEPLLEYMKGLKGSSDPYMVFQAVYAFQALQYVPDDETILQALLRRTGKVVRGVSGLVSAVKAMDLNGFVQGLQDIQGGLSAVGSAIALAQDAYSNAKALIESGQDFLDSLKEGFSFTQKSAWYPALRGLDRLLQEGRFAEFEKLIRGAPCRLDPAFQWGVGQRLGELAVNTAWDESTRKGAVAFLAELYRDDATWGQQANVKIWILRILSQLAGSTNGLITTEAQRQLQELKNNGTDEKRALYQACIDEHKERIATYPMLVSLPPQGSPLLNSVQDKPDVETPLRRLKHDRLKGQDVNVYISPRAKANSRATDDFDLTSNAQEFIESDKKVFLILGDSGSGKSTFNRALEVSLWEKYDGVSGRIPLFVYLPSIDKPEHDLVAKQLRKFDFTENQIKELKTYHKFIVICDGYDESQQTRNLYTSNKFNYPGEWDAQMVISCRTEYTGVDYRDFFQPANRNTIGDSGLFQEATIIPFNKGQIQAYIEQYVSLTKSPWGPKDYLRAIDQIPNLVSLVKNPFLLRLALAVLPQLFNTGSNFSVARVTRIGLYDEFFGQWIERGKKRLAEIELSAFDKEAFRTLHPEFKKHCIAYLKEFVTAIYERHGGGPVISFSEHRDRETWKADFFSNKDGKNILREAMPLIRNGDHYSFIHKSLQEYSLALAVFDPTEFDETSELVPAKSNRMSMSSVLSFEIPNQPEETALPVGQSLLESPLGKQHYISEAAILQFLAERVQEQPLLKNQLLAVIERSKIDKSARVAAANAITVLVKAGVQFNGVDLRDIKVPGADLSYGMFDSAQLKGADLRKTNLRSTWLRKADFSGALMTGVSFGELPFLQQESVSTCSAYSPDGKKYAVGLSNGNVNLYDTSDWRRINELQCESEGVRCLAFSATSDRIATGNEDKTVQLWDVESGSRIHTLQGHPDRIDVVVFSPNGNQIASAGESDETLWVWDIETGVSVHVLKGHIIGIATIAYSPDGTQLASAGWDEVLRLWNVVTGECTFILQGHNMKIHSIAYSPRGNHIASGSYDNTVRLWDVETGSCIHVLQGHTGYVKSIAYSLKGTQLASGSSDKSLRLWDTDTGDCIHILEGHYKDITSVMYSPKGDQIASISEDLTIRIWDADSGSNIHVLRGHTGTINTAVYSPRGDQIASGGYDDTIRLWDVDTGDSVHSGHGHTHHVMKVVYLPKKNLVASGSWDKTLRLWDADTGDQLYTLQGHSLYINHIANSPNEDLIVSASSDHTARLWDVDSGNCIHVLQGHTGLISRVAFSPRADKIASIAQDRTSRLWDVKSGSCLHILQSDSKFINDFAFLSEDRFAFGNDDETVQLWNVDTGDCVLTIQRKSNYPSDAFAKSLEGNIVTTGNTGRREWLSDAYTGDGYYVTKRSSSSYLDTVVYSPMGNQVALKGYDLSVQLLDLESGNRLHLLEGHSSFVACVSYSPNGNHIASGSHDKTARLWDTETGQCLLVISGFGDVVSSVVWSHNGQCLVTGSRDKSVRVWQIVKERDEYKAIMRWSSLHEALEVSEASFNEVQGLSQVNRNILSQRGASIE